MRKQRKGLNVVTKNSETIAQLYDTLILEATYTTIKLNSGGFKTNHTKNCMNDLLPTGYSVYQKNYEWYVSTPNGAINFEDNMIIEVA